jgi:hypothetical protein
MAADDPPAPVTGAFFAVKFIDRPFTASGPTETILSGLSRNFPVANSRL